MNGELCSVCHKRIATVFITQIDNKGQQVNKGLCLVCAKKMNLPQVTQFLDKMGISDEDLENMTESMDSMLESLGEDIDDNYKLLSRLGLLQNSKGKRIEKK